MLKSLLMVAALTLCAVSASYAACDKNHAYYCGEGSEDKTCESQCSGAYSYSCDTSDNCCNCVA